MAPTLTSVPLSLRYQSPRQLYPLGAVENDALRAPALTWAGLSVASVQGSQFFLEVVLLNWTDVHCVEAKWHWQLKAKEPRHFSDLSSVPLVP